MDIEFRHKGVEVDFWDGNIELFAAEGYGTDSVRLTPQDARIIANKLLELADLKETKSPLPTED